MGEPQRISRTQSYSFNKAKTKAIAIASLSEKDKTKARLWEDRQFVENLSQSLEAPGSKPYFYKCLKHLSKGQISEIEGRALKSKEKGYTPLFYFINACQKEFELLGV